MPALILTGQPHIDERVINQHQFVEVELVGEPFPLGLVQNSFVVIIAVGVETSLVTRDPNPKPYTVTLGAAHEGKLRNLGHTRAMKYPKGGDQLSLQVWSQIRGHTHACLLSSGHLCVTNGLREELGLDQGHTATIWKSKESNPKLIPRGQGLPDWYGLSTSAQGLCPSHRRALLSLS